MNLILVDISLSGLWRFYFNNKSLGEFLNLFNNDKRIILNKLFAHTPSKEFDKFSFAEELEVKDLKNMKQGSTSLFIDSINFTVEDIEVDISNEYEYLVILSSLTKEKFEKVFYEFLKISKNTWDRIQKRPNEYFLIEEDSILKTFSSFDEYLVSEYSRFL